MEKLLLSGNEAVALAGYNCGVSLGVGYPGTPSTEILEELSELGGNAQWAPNEKVALEVAIGVAFGNGRALATMKHVGVNVAADPLFTCAYTGVSGGLVIISADDPGMASSQNEQDNRNYARAAGIVMLEPSDSQEAYDFVMRGFAISHEWGVPVMVRMTTRVCHSKTVVVPKDMKEFGLEPVRPGYERNCKERVMIPAYARPAHRRLRDKLAKIEQWNDSVDINKVVAGANVKGGEGRRKLGIITSGISYVHVREAVDAVDIEGVGVLKLGMTYPLPLGKIREFAGGYERVLVIEEGDPYLVESLRAAGVAVEGKDEMYRFNELNVGRVKRIINGDTSPEVVPAKGKPPQLCVGCPHRSTFEVLRDCGCIVSGDIGCYTLGVLPPYEAMDTCVCMGASLGVGLGLRHVLPEEQGRKVVSVIGDSTFVHSGITGLVDMVYNKPELGHVLLILDNSITAMTGMQEHPATGRRLNHEATHKLIIEDLVKAVGVERVYVVDPYKQKDELRQLVEESMAIDDLTVIITRRVCVLAAKKIKQYEAINDSQ